MLKRYVRSALLLFMITGSVFAVVTAPVRVIKSCFDFTQTACQNLLGTPPEGAVFHDFVLVSGSTVLAVARLLQKEAGTFVLTCVSATAEKPVNDILPKTVRRWAQVQKIVIADAVRAQKTAEELSAEAGALLSSVITVVDYNPLWPDLFEKEAASLKDVFGDNCLSVHHVGSSSVSGLSGKPIIDMVVEVADLGKVGIQPERLEYQSFGECWLPLMRFFLRPTEAVMYKLHVFEKGNPEIARLTAFRDYLRTHSDMRARYEAVKRDSATKNPGDIAAYSAGKNEIVAEIDRLAGADLKRVTFASSPQAREACSRLITQPEGSTIVKEFVLVEGLKVLAVARIFKLAEGFKRLYVSSDKREKSHETQLVKTVTRWAGLQKIELAA